MRVELGGWTNLFIDTRLFLLDLLLQPLQRSSIWCSTVCLEHLYVPANDLASWMECGYC